MEAYIIYWLLGIVLVPGFIFAAIAQAKITSTYRSLKHQPAQCEKTADQVAREILDKNGLQEINLIQTSGELTDHYNPSKQEIALSTDVYGSNSIAALSIAAHEVGHAIQRKEGYFASKLRTFLVPVVNFSSAILWPLVVIGLIINVGASWNSLVGDIFLWIGIAFFGISVLFSLITLPTELDASKRAIQQLTEGGYITNEVETEQSKSVLKAAAMTYVASLVVSILHLIRFLLTILIARNE
ncbi:MAG: zinc metallopeptidase [Clostridia bacterium]|nr:zinc metallopeptidase [Clostridia bacterium]